MHAHRSKTLLFLTLLMCSVLMPRLADAEDPLRPNLANPDPLYDTAAPFEENHLLKAGMPLWAAVDTELRQEIEPRDRVRTVEGLQPYDLTEPPRRTLWWNYPLYGVAGGPRDLLDGFFGVVRFVPPINLLITGVGYEIIPTQALVRHRKDRHGWMGRANKNEHGWIDAEKGWGFWSHWRHTSFRPLDEKEMERRKRFNAQLARKVEAVNQAVGEHNEKVEERRLDAVSAATRHLRAGNYRVAIRIARTILDVHPRDRDARAIYAAALVAQMRETTHGRWAHKELHGLLSSGYKRTLILTRSEIRRFADDQPTNPWPPFYQVWINRNLETYGPAMSECAHLAALDPANENFHRLRFEIALESGEEAWIDAALADLEDAAGRESEVAQDALGRVLLRKGLWEESTQTWLSLVTARPEEPRYHYLLGVARIQCGRATGRCDKPAALESFEYAIRLAENTETENLYRAALQKAKKVEVLPPSGP